MTCLPAWAARVWLRRSLQTLAPCSVCCPSAVTRERAPCGAGRGRQGAAARPAGFRKAIQSLVATDNGENNALEPFNDGGNVATLQNMYNGIIGDPGRFREPPQARPVCTTRAACSVSPLQLVCTLRVCAQTTAVPA
jgi:hypothetical protein